MDSMHSHPLAGACRRARGRSLVHEHRHQHLESRLSPVAAADASVVRVPRCTATHTMMGGDGSSGYPYCIAPILFHGKRIRHRASKMFPRRALCSQASLNAELLSVSTESNCFFRTGPFAASCFELVIRSLPLRVSLVIKSWLCLTASSRRT